MYRSLIFEVLSCTIIQTLINLPFLLKSTQPPTLMKQRQIIKKLFPLSWLERLEKSIKANWTLSSGVICKMILQLEIVLSSDSSEPSSATAC